jgi:hypothetical protein
LHSLCVYFKNILGKKDETALYINELPYLKFKRL